MSRTHSGHVKCGKLQPTPPAITWLWTCWHGGAIACGLRSQTKSRCHLLQDPVVGSVDRNGCLTNDLRQQRYFPNDIAPDWARLRGLPCPHHTLATNSPNSKLLTEKEFSNSPPIFPGGTSGKESACQCGRPKKHGFDPYTGKMPRGGNGNPLQYSSLENPMDRGAWGLKELDTIETTWQIYTQLSSISFFFFFLKREISLFKRPQ